MFAQMQRYKKLKDILYLKKMPKSSSLTDRIFLLLNKDPGKMVKELAEELNVNRTFLAGYLEALENQGHVKSKKVGPPKVYFNTHSKGN